MSQQDQTPTKSEANAPRPEDAMTRSRSPYGGDNEPWCWLKSENGEGRCVNDGYLTQDSPQRENVNMLGEVPILPTAATNTAGQDAGANRISTPPDESGDTETQNGNPHGVVDTKAVVATQQTAKDNDVEKKVKEEAQVVDCLDPTTRGLVPGVVQGTNDRELSQVSDNDKMIVIFPQTGKVKAVWNPSRYNPEKVVRGYQDEAGRFLCRIGDCGMFLAVPGACPDCLDGLVDENGFAGTSVQQATRSTAVEAGDDQMRAAVAAADDFLQESELNNGMQTQQEEHQQHQPPQQQNCNKDLYPFECFLGWCEPGKNRVMSNGEICPPCKQLQMAMMEEGHQDEQERGYSSAARRNRNRDAGGRLSGNTNLNGNGNGNQGVNSEGFPNQTKTIIVACCYAMRRQRCRYGATCKYAHDIPAAMERLGLQTAAVEVVCERKVPVLSRKYPRRHHR